MNNWTKSFGIDLEWYKCNTSKIPKTKYETNISIFILCDPSPVRYFFLETGRDYLFFLNKYNLRFYSISNKHARNKNNNLWRIHMGFHNDRFHEYL